MISEPLHVSINEHYIDVWYEQVEVIMGHMVEVIMGHMLIPNGHKNHFVSKLKNGPNQTRMSDIEV